jgi:hypothetical protein
MEYTAEKEYRFDGLHAASVLRRVQARALSALWVFASTVKNGYIEWQLVSFVSEYRMARH